jgi:hypothetical protein
MKGYDFAQVTWSTACWVPTATAIAEHLGYLDGIAAGPLRQLRELAPERGGEPPSGS